MGSFSSKNDSWTSIPCDFSIETGKKVGPRDRYSLEARVGGGNFGEVYRAKDNEENGEDVAIKFLPRGPNLNPVYVRREILNHRRMSHPHIIGYREVFLTDRHLCIVMNFAAGGNLQTYVSKHQNQKLSEDMARWFFQQLILALDYCHKQHIVIRDIKLSNILLSEDQKSIMLCDFGFSKHYLGDSRAKTFLGTDPYLPPEVLAISPELERSFSGFPVESIYCAKKFDIWTCGIVLFTMLTGRNPFYSLNDPAPSRRKHMFGRMINFKKRAKTVKTRKLLMPEGISAECCDFMDKILDLNPSTRISIESIMKHKWFSHNLPPAFLEYNNTQGMWKDKSLYMSREEIEEMIGLARENSYIPVNAFESVGSSGIACQTQDQTQQTNNTSKQIQPETNRQSSRELLGLGSEKIVPHRRAFSVGMVE